MTALDIIRSVAMEPCRPWPRHILSVAQWTALTPALAADSTMLLALWADTMHVHALFLDEPAAALVAATAPVEAGGFAALSVARPGAAWFERAIQDLWGHAPLGGTELRPWLDHGYWPHRRPLSERPGLSPGTPEPPELNTEMGPGGMQLPIGPLTGRIEDAAHLRLTLNGEVVVLAECRLGYTHKGSLASMRGKSPRAAVRFAARLSGAATVAHSLAFAEAAEAALDIEAPPRARALRSAMAEVERISGHMDDLAEMAVQVGARSIHSECGRLREILARALGLAFGHRLAMDCVVPGGVAADIEPAGADGVLRAMGDVAEALPRLRRSHASSAYAARLVGLGMVDPAEVRRYAAGGVVGRAAGRSFDARQFSRTGALSERLPDTGADTGDAFARCQVRLAEIADSMRSVVSLLRTLPSGPIAVPLPMTSGEGIGCAESVGGDIWCWMRLDHGLIAEVFPRDPGWALWPLAEQALKGARLEDVALICRSFGLSASGMDL